MRTLCTGVSSSNNKQGPVAGPSCVSIAYKSTDFTDRADQLLTCCGSSLLSHTHRIQINLHLVVSMDPSNELFRSRCESNPALITRASIQWLETWSNKGMNEISAAKLKVGICSYRYWQGQGSTSGYMLDRTGECLIRCGGGKRLLALLLLLCLFCPQEMVSASQVVSKAAAAGAKDEEVAQLMVQMHNMMGASVQPREYVAFVNLYSRICSDKRKQASFMGWGYSWQPLDVS